MPAKNSKRKIKTPEVGSLDFYRLAAMNSLINFAQLIDKKYKPNWHHEEIANAIERAYDKVKAGGRARIILELPPRHGKSRLATEITPAWLLAKDPAMPIIVSAHTAQLAERFGLRSKMIMTSEEYEQLFPHIRLRKDSKAKANWMTNKGGQYIGVGVGGSITGQGAVFAIVDDPIKNREEAESGVYREKIWDWFTSTLYTRLEGPGAVIVIMTRWHTDDLVGRLLAKQREDEEAGKEHYDQWEVIRFPAIAEEDEKYRKVGEPLWKDKFSVEDLEVIKNLNLYDWHSLYQQNPIHSATQEFRQEMFKTYKPEDIKDIYLAHYTFVDPAISVKQGADNSVVLTIGKEVYGPRWFRIREDAGRFSPDKLVDLIFQHQEEYKSNVFIETIAFQEALKYSVLEEQRKREKYFVINELKPRGSKELRIRGLLPLYTNGVIYHLPTDYEYERELVEFPRGKHDDRADAMSFGLVAVKNTQKRNKVKVVKRKIKGYFQ